jgi:hypothetical protein
MNIMSGYAVHIRRLTDEDIRIHSIDMRDHNPDDCIAVEGEDLGPTLCAVVDMSENIDGPRLVWSSVPPTGDDGEWHAIEDDTFAHSLARVVTTLVPEVFAK